MSDYFDVLARVAQVTIDSEYYESAKPSDGMHFSLRKAILRVQSGASYRGN